jgi:hypothetical protein
MDIAAAPADPTIKARFDALGGTVFALSPDQFGKLLATRRRGGQGGMGGQRQVGIDIGARLISSRPEPLRDFHGCHNETPHE